MSKCSTAMITYNIKLSMNPLLFQFFSYLKLTSGELDVIEKDISRWQEVYKLSSQASKHNLFSTLWGYSEFRTLFYYRTGNCRGLGWCIRFALQKIYPPAPTLYIDSPEIGPGLFIQHGFCTIISAKKLGKNCWINQQVTVGYSNATDCPIIGDNVTINAGAKVIGNVTVGNNSTVGANAVVVKNVPENCTVVGVPAYIVRKNGIKTKEPLS